MTQSQLPTSTGQLVVCIRVKDGIVRSSRVMSCFLLTCGSAVHETAGWVPSIPFHWTIKQHQGFCTSLAPPCVDSLFYGIYRYNSSMHVALCDLSLRSQPSSVPCLNSTASCRSELHTCAPRLVHFFDMNTSTIPLFVCSA